PNNGNQVEGTGARGLVHAIGGGEADQDLNDMEDDINEKPRHITSRPRTIRYQIFSPLENLLNHPFNIELIPVELGSSDIIIGMDWLSVYHAIIAYAEKIIRIPWGSETLIVHGDRSNQGNETRLNNISYTKTQKYLLKGHHVFLAHVITKDTNDKLGEKRLEDVPIV
ncbi:putative reverse transcriptase domain-containing protein, partial [Tanacetum coccineum]